MKKERDEGGGGRGGRIRVGGDKEERGKREGKFSSSTGSCI